MMTTLGRLSFGVLAVLFASVVNGATTVGSYVFDSVDIVSSPDYMYNGSSWVNPSASTELSDNAISTFLATTYNNSWDVSLDLGFATQSSVTNTTGADLYLFFLFDQDGLVGDPTPNVIDVTYNGLTESYAGNLQTLGDVRVDGVNWGGSVLNQVVIQVAEIDLTSFGLGDGDMLQGNFTLNLVQNNTLAPVALAMAGAKVAPVPIPAAVWLFGSGLLGLVGVARRRA